MDTNVNDSAKKADAKPAGAKPADAKPADAKPANAKPADAKPADEVRAAEDAVEEFTTTIQADVTALVDAHPVATLVTALGVGYALGGGLFTSLTYRLLKWGFRLGVQFAVLPALEQEVASLAGALGKRLDPDADGDEGPAGAPAHQ